MLLDNFKSYVIYKKVEISGVSVITGVVPGTAFSTLINGLENIQNADVQIQDADGDVITSGVFASGYQLVLMYNDIELERHTIYVLGDTDGDGQNTTADLNDLVRFIGGTYLPAYSGAADFDGNGSIDYSDLAKLINIIAGIE